MSAAKPTSWRLPVFEDWANVSAKWPWGWYRDAARDGWQAKTASMAEVLEAAESILRYAPDISTNCNGTRPQTTTTTALAMVRAALAEAAAQQPDPTR